MTDKLRQAAQQILEAATDLTILTPREWQAVHGLKINALRTALAEQPAEQEPVALEISCEHLDAVLDTGLIDTCGMTAYEAARKVIEAFHTAPQPAQTPTPTESVLIEGVAYTVPAQVAAELLRLHLEIKSAHMRMEQPAEQEPQTEDVAADAYSHACDEMVRWQRKRRLAGKEAGTTGSLCDGIAWLYLHIDTLERTALAEPAEQEPVALERSETTVPYEGFGMAHREAERKHQAAITAIKEHLK